MFEGIIKSSARAMVGEVENLLAHLQQAIQQGQTQQALQIIANIRAVLGRAKRFLQ